MLPYGRQTIDDADIAAVVEVLRSPLLTCGPLVTRFEQALAAKLGAKHASVCSSGTAALHLVYAALDIGAGAELITTREGGAIVTPTAALKRRIDRLRQHGVERDPSHMQQPPAGSWSYEVQELGWNYRLSDLSCALGLAQLAKLDRFVARRRELAALYRTALAGLTGVTAPPESNDRESAYHLFAVAIDFARFGTTRARLTERLAARGIGTQVHYIPLYDHPLHKQHCGEVGPHPGADHYYARTLSLPLFPAMTDADVGEVVAQLHRALGDSQ